MQNKPQLGNSTSVTGKIKRILGIAALLCGACFGQTVNTNIYPATSGLKLGNPNQRWTIYASNIDIIGTCKLNGVSCLGGNSGIPITTVAGLASIPAVNGTFASVIDGASSADCTGGGGTNRVLCVFNGSVWTAYAGGGGGGSTPPGGSSGTIQYNNAGTFGGFADGTAHQVLHGGKTFGAVTALDVDSTIAQTGVDINTSFQVTSLHLAGALSVTQGGIGVGTLTGIAKGNGTSAFTAAAFGDVVHLWASGSCVGYLANDGTCSTPAGGGTVTSSGPPVNHQLAIFTASTNIKGLTLGTDQMVGGVTGADPVAQEKPEVDIQDFYTVGSSADFAAALNTIFSTYPGGVTVNLNSLSKNNGSLPISVYAASDPFVGVAGGYQVTFKGGCGVNVVMSATWHTPLSGAVIFDDCGKASASSNQKAGLQFLPCVAAAGCGPGNFAPQFPFSLSSPVAGTAVAVGPPLTPTVYSTGTATFTSGSTAVTGSGTTWTNAMVGGWILDSSSLPAGGTSNCVGYIKAVNSTTSITLAQNFDKVNTGGGSCTVRSSGSAHAYQILEPNAVVMIWLGSQAGGGAGAINTQQSVFGQKMYHVGGSLEGMANGIAVFSTNMQELSELWDMNWDMDAGYTGAATGFHGTPLAAIMCDSSFIPSGIGGACAHSFINDVAIHQAAVGTSSTDYGFIGDSYNQVDAKAKDGISWGLFSTIAGSSGNAFKSAVYLDGSLNGTVTVTHDEFSDNSIEMGDKHPTAANILSINKSNPTGAKNGVLFDSHATYGTTVLNFSAFSSGINMINDANNPCGGNSTCTITSSSSGISQNGGPYIQPSSYNGTSGQFNMVTAMIDNSTGQAPITSSGTTLRLGSSNATVDASGNYTGVSYIGSASNGGYVGTEGTGANVSFGASKDGFYPDSTNHCLHANYNNTDVGCEVAGGTTAVTSGDLAKYSSTNPAIIADSGVATTNVVTAASNAAATGMTWTSGGTNKTAAATDFWYPEFIPAANCNNTTAGAGWSIPSGGTVTCRAGTNNLGGFITITDTSSTFAQFMTVIPFDWDTGTRPYIRVYFASASDTTNGHTVIPQVKVSCSQAVNGTTSDDATFTAAQSLSTTTFGGSAVANGIYAGSNVQFGSTQMSGCVAGGLFIVQIGRATDTATGNINFYGATINWPRQTPGVAQAD